MFDNNTDIPVTSTSRSFCPKSSSPAVSRYSFCCCCSFTCLLCCKSSQLLYVSVHSRPTAFTVCMFADTYQIVFPSSFESLFAMKFQLTLFDPLLHSQQRFSVISLLRLSLRVSSVLGRFSGLGHVQQ